MRSRLAEPGRPGTAVEVVDGGDVDPATGALLSVAELQDALRAARAAHAGGTGPLSPRAVPAAAAVTGAVLSVSRGDIAASSVVVLGAHGGAGASTVALAIAEAASVGRRVRMVDCADGSRSGLVAASSEELGVDAAGWRRGRRGPLEIHRFAHRVGSIGEVPAPAGDLGAGGLLVVDIGWPVRDVLDAPGWVGAALAGAALVVVCRTSLPGVHHAEQVLAGLDRAALVAAVGRWPSVVAASCGPCLRQARTAGRVVTVPTNRGLEATGVTSEALPKPITAAGKALAALLAAGRPSSGAGHNK